MRKKIKEIIIFLSIIIIVSISFILISHIQYITSPSNTGSTAKQPLENNRTTTPNNTSIPKSSIKRINYEYKRFNYDLLRSGEWEKPDKECLNGDLYTINCTTQFIEIVHKLLTYYNISVNINRDSIFIKKVVFNNKIVDYLWIWSYGRKPSSENNMLVVYEAVYGKPVAIYVPLRNSSLLPIAEDIMRRVSRKSIPTLNLTNPFKASTINVSIDTFSHLIGIDLKKNYGELRQLYTSFITPTLSNIVKEADIYFKVYINGAPVLDPIQIYGFGEKVVSISIMKTSKGSINIGFDVYTPLAEPDNIEGFRCYPTKEKLEAELRKLTNGFNWSHFVIINISKIYYLSVRDDVLVYNPGYLVDISAYSNNLDKILKLKLIVNALNCSIYDYSGYMEMKT